MNRKRDQENTGLPTIIFLTNHHIPWISKILLWSSSTLEGDTMKALVVFYSRTGTTKKLARAISDILECDIEELIDTKKRSGVVGWLMSAKDGAQKNPTTIKELEKNPVYYDVVVIGTPIWAGAMSAGTRTFITQEKEHFKKVAFFTSSGSGKSEATFGQMEELCGKKPVGTLALTTKELQQDQYREKVEGFTAMLRESLEEKEEE